MCCSSPPCSEDPDLFDSEASSKCPPLYHKKVGKLHDTVPSSENLENICDLQYSVLSAFLKKNPNHHL